MSLLTALVAMMPVAALAEGASITVEPEGARAPAALVLTASVATDDAIVAYDWGRLGARPRCRTASCPLALPIAACERVEVTATTELGETVTASIAACARDDGGVPPRAELRITEAAGVASIEPSWTLGTSAVVITRLWVDDLEVLEPARPTGRFLGAGCHAIDLLVVDDAGRFGLDRRSVCGDPDAPRAWLGADAPYLAPDGALAPCLEVDHPLGLTVEPLTDVPIEGCAAPEVPPRALERRWTAVRDGRGATSFASVFVAGVAEDTPPTLFFAALSGTASGIAGRSFDVPLLFAGGEGPYRVEGVLSDAAAGVSIPIATVVPAGVSPKVTLTSPSIAPSGRLDLVVTDVRGREARVSGAVTVYPGSVGPDGGAAGCATTGAPSDRGLFVLLGLALFVRRRAR